MRRGLFQSDTATFGQQIEKNQVGRQAGVASSQSSGPVFPFDLSTERNEIVKSLNGRSTHFRAHLKVHLVQEVDKGHPALGRRAVRSEEAVAFLERLLARVEQALEERLFRLFLQ